MHPRWYQVKIINGVRDAWSNGHKNVLAVSPARSGKTPIIAWLSEPFIQSGQGVVIQAHREELVRQLALTFAEFGYDHNIYAPKDVIADIIHRQVKEFGRSFYNARSTTIIGSVQTLNARADKLVNFAPRVRLWVTDETHHLLADNQWGKAIALFPNAFGVGFTATPARTDRKSLARAQGGVFDAMVKGVTARQLIDEKYICDYRIIAPPSSINRDEIKVGAKGEFTQKGLTEAKRQSTITGDCVRSYLEFTPDQQAVVFAVDISHSQELCDAYRAAGVSAETVSSKTPKQVRKMIMDKFERGIFKVLVNVDLFGEGLNVTGIEVVIMARPTQSFVLYVQQFFRALTRASGKTMGTIIDHVGNVGHFGRMYGLPDTYNNWELIAEERGRKSRAVDDDIVPVIACTACFAVYEAIHSNCPYCGHKPIPADRSKPEHVDGDLVELDQETLAALRGDADRIMRDAVIPRHLQTQHGSPAEVSIVNKHTARREAQAALRYNISLWAGYWKEQGNTDSEIYKRFYFRFDIDIATAQTLSAQKATILNERVDSAIQKILSDRVR